VEADGNLVWSPTEYEFQKGSAVRYIDYEAGDDNNDGLTKTTAWKHHPWDIEATGNAAQGSGVVTYIFKGGVMYRGQMQADESGTAEEPIRLTWDPSWGEGKPWIVGSSRVPQKWVKASQVGAPDRMPEVDKVWAVDLSGTDYINVEKKQIDYLKPDGRGHWNPPSAAFTALFIVKTDGSTQKMHLARTPDWQPSAESFAMDYWHSWDGSAEFEGPDGQELSGPYDDIWKGKPQDYFTGGFMWSQYPLFMGTPIASEMPATVQDKKTKKEIPFFYPEAGAFKRGFPGGIKENVRYMIENLPQFLDAENEFYLDFDRGILFLRLADGVDPNELHMEIGHDYGTISIDSQSYIDISGLQFSFAHGNTIGIGGNCSYVNVHHCDFYDACQIGVSASIGMARKEPTTAALDHIRVADCDFKDVWETGVTLSDGSGGSLVQPFGRLLYGEILRNNFYNSGMRHNGNIQSNVPTAEMLYAVAGEVAGNIVRRSFGSGIVVFGGKEGALGSFAIRTLNVPMIRIYVHHNLTEDTALGVNDYGGLALWQGGPIYAWSNNIGSSPGHMPGGFWGIPMTNLSYPLYLDGAYKIYSFNNIIWGASIQEDDPYRSINSAYFMVFGFLNQFANNTVYRHGKGIGGSSGNRCDIVGNLFSEIKDVFLANNRTGDPSLVGGGDDASSGLRGVPSLAYKANLFQGEAEAGAILKQKYEDRERTKPLFDIPTEISAKEISKMEEQMKDYPIRYPELGKQVEERPIIGSDAAKIVSPDQVDFRLTANSSAIDAGAIYFIPFSLYGTVGEWHFTENVAKPDTVIDYHFFMDESHFYRMMYEQVPTFDIQLNNASLGDYVAGPEETWAKGAMVFDGKRFGSYPDSELRKDYVIPLSRFKGKHKDRIPDEKPFEVVNPNDPENGYVRYPVEMRKTLRITTENLLVEANLKVDSGQTKGCILSKHDGKAGYRLYVNADGKAEFQISSGGRNNSVVTAAAINDGKWHHVLAELDRETGRMTIYLDGKESAEAKAAIPATASLDAQSDFLVGKAHDDSMFLRGAIDFMRVCQGTLEDANTDIAELYEWQTNGPWKYDFAGNPPKGKARDAGALELK
ncbi:MAG: LamG domain-containing protein, partial [bacterium]